MHELRGEIDSACAKALLALLIACCQSRVEQAVEVESESDIVIDLLCIPIAIPTVGNEELFNFVQIGAHERGIRTLANRPQSQIDECAEEFPIVIVTGKLPCCREIRNQPAPSYSIVWWAECLGRHTQRKADRTELHQTLIHRADFAPVIRVVRIDTICEPGSIE